MTTPLRANTEAADDLEAARDELDALEQERASIWSRIAAAAEDPDTLLALRKRADALPAYLFAAQVRVLRLSIAALERRRDEAQAELADLGEPWESARKALEEARQRFAEVERRIRTLRSVAYDANSDLQERQRQLALLLAGRT